MRTRAHRLHTFFLTSALVIAAASTTLSPTAQAQNYASPNNFGSYYRLFSSNSPWNSRPVNPVLGSNQVKKPLLNPNWIPSITDGTYSVGVFMGKAGDKPMTVYGRNAVGVSDPDSGKRHNIVIPRWPNDVVPSPGSDGHADIVDTVTGIIHSFYQLKYANGSWTATMYAWTRVDGNGWGNAEHWSQGVRASGTVPAAGLIRLHEIDDGLPNYRHALAMSLPSHTLANGITRPSYVAPATTTDSTAALNTGVIPMGARLMLPASFDANSLSTPQLRKIANTLKMYGAFVVDRNYDTAFSIYVENGSNFKIMPNGVWNNQVVADLEKIRAALRELVSAPKWLDGYGNTLNVNTQQSLLSMRGTWVVNGATVAGPGTFDTWQQSVVFPNTAKRLSQVNYSTGLSQVSWAKVPAGTRMRFTAKTTGGASSRLQLKVAGVQVFDSGYLLNGNSATFTWPSAASSLISVAVLSESGVNMASSARGVLTVE